MSRVMWSNFSAHGHGHGHGIFILATHPNEISDVSHLNEDETLVTTTKLLHITIVAIAIDSPQPWSRFGCHGHFTVTVTVTGNLL
jgi:hypothetical protein